jgi:hypothetical protein
MTDLAPELETVHELREFEAPGILLHGLLAS